MPTPPPATMRAAILAEDRLEVREIATPVPGPGEALLRVSACGVCHTDLHVMKGEVRFPRPAVLGHEVSGSIVAIGAGTADTRRLQVGDRVAAGFIMPCGTCAQCARDRDDLCTEFFRRNRLEGTLYDGRSRLAMPDGSFLAMYSMGGLAEYAVVPLTALTSLDDHLDLDTACILGCSGLTSYGAVFRAGAVAPGMSVAIVGVGGIGTSLIPMARAAGAERIVAIDIAQEKLVRAKDLGATDVVDAAREDPVARVRELTGGVDVAFEALGRPATFAQAVGMLADGGRMVAIGIAAGAAVAEIEITPLVRRGQQIIGSFGARTRTDLPQVAALAASGSFDPADLVSRRYTLDQADEAYRALSRGEITGRAIITMSAARAAEEQQ
ncbi:S-(hydroxymethyl)glutathione dehydrogenase/alcohol dehydrogenase [Microbacterium sp. AK009]|uniref:zinc-binding dehydrogenase n=1 Tax=Microbacterium sp. AK009 TaxID=2723068 RepID=UPI001807816F|nr:zinc-binding dehydrogenase [Microbacterium sp. AK009]NYF16821.1 S-(hydroxymethyl)glutathione dehydrogenase/alcohol dehydrogenase [Microbacterium sp. AK009]